MLRRGDGLYDVPLYGRALTLGQVADILLALATWPNCLPRVAPALRPDQRWRWEEQE